VRVLVAYARRNGDTRRIAERIANSLGRSGLHVTVARIDSAPRVSQYDAFVIGGTASRGHWLNEGAGFVRLHAWRLADCPVWLFSSQWTNSSSSDATPCAQRGAAPWEFTEFEQVIDPRDLGVFTEPSHRSSVLARVAGALIARAQWMARSVRQLRSFGGVTDTGAVETWAQGIARNLAVVGELGAR
jgi:menaquinone-dependent protoporphyrinogen oxidase